MKEQIQIMIDNLYQQVKDKVPAEGEFPVVFEEYKVEDKKVDASHILLKVSHASLEKTGKERFLDLAVLNYPSPYGAESTVRFGTTEDILRELQSPALLEDILTKLPRLISDLSDV